MSQHGSDGSNGFVLWESCEIHLGQLAEDIWEGLVASSQQSVDSSADLFITQRFPENDPPPQPDDDDLPDLPSFPPLEVLRGEANVDINAELVLDISSDSEDEESDHGYDPASPIPVAVEDDDSDFDYGPSLPKKPRFYWQSSQDTQEF